MQILHVIKIRKRLAAFSCLLILLSFLWLQLEPGQPLPSPQEMMGKILIKNKKKHHHHRPSSGGSIRRREQEEQSSPNNGERRQTPAYTSFSSSWGDGEPVLLISV